MSAASKSILVVEDAPDIQSLIKQLYEIEGYEVFTASNGQEALHFLKTSSIRPGLILLDLMMPIMSGFEFMEVQKQDSQISDIPVVVMTAYASTELKNKNLSSKEFLTKPIDVDVLLKTAERYCA